MSFRKPLIELTDFQHPQISVPYWKICACESWCVFGLNGSGKQAIAQLLSGNLSGSSGCVETHVLGQNVALVSFETQQELYESEIKLASSDYISEAESGTKLIDFFPKSRINNPLIDEFGLRHRLSVFYRDLSTGEGRKALILRALLEEPSLLILDNPFDSLDGSSVSSLSALLDLAMERSETSIIFLLSNRSDIPEWTTRFGYLDQTELIILSSLPKEDQLKELAHLVSSDKSVLPAFPKHSISLEAYHSEFIADLRDVTVAFDGHVILDKLNFSIAPLQHTLVTGENGSGKSTLLSLITGDCMQCYSNSVNVFGYRRGTGESVWDIKRLLGIVSTDLHRRYTVRVDTFTVICSGFHDSIGLYEPLSDFQLRIARDWLGLVGLDSKAELPFDQISFGEQRMALIARAMVKSPLLLVLDEPTQGLDEINRQKILGFLSIIESRRHSTILFVSHREDEFLPIFNQHLQLPPKNQKAERPV